MPRRTSSIYIYSLIDTEFNEDIDIELPDNWKQSQYRGKLFDEFLKIYERRKLNVAANAMTAIIYLSDYWCQRNELITILEKWSVKYNQYADDIAKYMMLV